MNTKIGIILIHGAGLGSFIWDDVISHFKYPVLTINFPNREMGDQSNKNIVFNDYLKSIIQQIEDWNVPQFIVVAHSIGGCLGMMLNDYFKEKLIGFIGLSAIIPKRGKSFTDCFPFPQRLVLPIILKLFGTRPPDKSLVHSLCNDLMPSKSDEIKKRFSPESIHLYTTKINYNTLPKKCLYIRLTLDNALDQNLQSKMIENLGCKDVTSIESGHLPMISQAKTLVDIIDNFTKKI